ncbi:MAG TPA: hypothetical protein VFU22_29395 [Roseiflexaceae bacterium]|nr:hypothetical protein [Roseiflexaceae bacterium]
MDTLVVILVLIVLAVAVGAIVWMTMQRRRTEELRQRFGPEYDHAVQELGDQHEAEAELQARQKRVERLNIQPLEPAERDRFVTAWRSTQAQFVDEPTAAITKADRLVAEVMRARGYPVGDFEQRAADISVDHPDVLEHYRVAHTIALANERGQANTEDLRQAMVHYRALFEELLETREREVSQ